MREYSSPLTVALPRTGNLTDDLVSYAAEEPDTVALRHRVGDDWLDVTAARFAEQVRGVARGLLAAGLEPGDRIALLSKTRYEWTLLDYAAWFAGLVTVPVYETSSADQIQWVLGDSGTSAIVAESHEHLARIAEHRADLPDLRHVWCLADHAVEVLCRLGGDVGDDLLEERRTAVTPLDLATIIYTSGTTGHPRGCMITHGNFMAELGVAVHELAPLFERAEGASEADRPSTLLFLPLAHVFARIVQIGAIRARAILGHTADTTHLSRDLGEFRPTFVLAVPRMFEKVVNTASQRATADGRGRIFEKATAVAIAWSRAQERGRVSPVLRAQHALYSRLVYSRIRAALGGRCQYAVAGGAPLGERLGHFFRGVGITVLEGYGLTETTAAVTVNTPEATRMGSVGRPLPGTTVRVSDEGELLFSGGQVFAGYWEDEEATAQVLGRDGWLRTGDLGEIDDEGFVRVTGRLKEILVTAGGKNVAPAGLEERVRAHPLVSQCLVVGDGQPYIAALVTLDPDMVATWAESRGRSTRAADLVDDPDLRAEIQEAVEEANASVSRAEAIRRFTILPEEWTEAAGHVTPSLKLKRTVVLRDFRDEVARLFLP